jgi:hypothetical protein
LVTRDGELFILSNNHILAACFDEETEVLTDSGFKRFPGVKMTDRIATLNPETHEIEYRYPEEYHEYEYAGPMIHFKGKFIDLMVTPNHRLYCKKTWSSGHRVKEGPWQFMTAVEALERCRSGRTTTVRLKRDGKWIGHATSLVYSIPQVKYYGPGFKVPYFDLESFLRFLGWYLADGSCCLRTHPSRGTEYVVSIRNTNPEHLDEIERTLEDMGLNPQRSKGDVRVYSKQLYSYVKAFGKARDKYVPQDIKMLPPRYLRIFFDAFSKGDGCHPSRAKQHGTSFRYFVSKSERLIDDLQEIALKLGLTGKKSIKYGSSHNPDGKYYILSVYDTNLEPVVCQEPKIIQYVGKVYCLTVPNHIMLVRRKGQVIWSGNSNEGEVGDPILQPGVYDGGTADDRIAVLADFVPINFGTGAPTCSIAKGVEGFLNWAAKTVGSSHRVAAFREIPGTNRVDAALARPLSADLVSREILEIGVPKGTRDATLGTAVKKSGRTSGFTAGEIIQIDVTAQVVYGKGRVAIFEDQLMAGAMSKGGDSGSVVLDEEDFIIGLLFAGSYITTLINPVQFVLEALNVEIAV